MEGIPPARASDNEQVRWALETAESLWKRDARVDAIVWLRRAAQEALDAGDADRASALVDEAAVLTDHLSRASVRARAALPPSQPPPADAGGDVDALLAGGDELLGDDDLEELDSTDLVSMGPTTPIPSGEPSLRDPTAEPSSEVPTPVAQPDSLSEQAEPFAEHPGVTRLGHGTLSSMDLAGVPAFAGLAEEARDRLVRAAVVILCAADALLPDCAFALVLEGALLARADAGPAVAQLVQGSILRTRTTLDAELPVHFAATADDTTLALWSDGSLARALAGTTSVDATLRAEADKLHAWAEVAMSPTASSLHEDVRIRLVSRLTARVLRPGEALVGAGEPVPGLLLVGVGKVTIDEPRSQVVGAGRFVFAGETLAAGRAGATARAGDDGAVVLCADRRTTQELCSTEPLLLEVLAADS